MNKARRNELKSLKYKKRIKATQRFSSKEKLLKIAALKTPIVIDEGGHKHNFTAYRTTGNPCTCIVCSGEKYNRAKEKQQNHKKLLADNE